MFRCLGVILLLVSFGVISASASNGEAPTMCQHKVASLMKRDGGPIRLAGPLSEGGSWSDDCCLSDLPCCKKAER